MALFDINHSLALRLPRRRGRRPLVALVGACLTAMVIGPVAGQVPPAAGATAAQAALSGANFVETWTAGPFADQGQPIAESSPTVADLDGQPAAVVGDRTGYLYAVHLSDGTPVAGWPVDAGAPIDSTPSVAALTGTAFDSVFVGTGNAQFPDVGGYEAYGPDGQQLWHTNVTDPTTDNHPAYGVQASLTVADLGGGTDVFAGSLDQESYALTATSGSVNWQFFTADSVFSTAAAADLYGGGQEDLVVGGASTAGLAMGQSYPQGGHVRILSPQGALLYDYDPNQEVDSSPAVGGFLANGATGIVVGTGSYWPGASDTDTVKAFTTRLVPVWSDKLDGSTSSSPALADVQGQGLDVVEGTDNGTSGSVWVLDGATGSTVWEVPVVGRVIGSVVAADLTGGGYQDLLVPTTHGVEVLDGQSGTEITVLRGDLGFQNSPLVTDDPDGTIGITIAGYNGNNEGVITHYEISGSDGALAVGPGSWPMFHHDPQLTGVSSPLPDVGTVVPSGLAAQAGNGQVSLSWTAPSPAGGAPVTGYNVYEGRAPGHEAGVPVNGTTPVPGTSYLVPGLTNGAKYYFEVTAITSAGEGAPSDEASATPAGPPTAPTNLTATAGDSDVSLSWGPPSSNGGSPVTGYNVYESSVAGSQGTAVLTGTALTTYTATSLTDGATYYFEVTATNGAGEGPPSAQVPATPMSSSTTTTTSPTTTTSTTTTSTTTTTGTTATTTTSSTTAPPSTTTSPPPAAVFPAPAETATSVPPPPTVTSTTVATRAASSGPPPLTGYRVVAATGQVFPLGKVASYPLARQSSPVVAVASTPDGRGYWLALKNGGMVAAGDARLYGSAAGKHLGSPVAGLAATPDGRGYWLVEANGTVLAFGDAHAYPLRGTGRPSHIVGIGPTADGRGYWLVSAAGAIFASGDARSYGSVGNARLKRPIVGIGVTTDGRGYWLAASDGGLFAFGDARYYGSLGTRKLNRPIVGILATADGRGYWLASSDGGVFGFGDAPFFGSLGGKKLHEQIVGITA